MLRKNPRFDIKLKYRKIFEFSIILSLFLTIVAFKAFPDIERKINLQIEPEELITTVIPPPTREPEVPPPPKPPIPISAPDDADVLVDIIIDQTDLDPNADVEPTQPPIIKDEEEEYIIFTVVEYMPIPIGGIAAIQKKVVYPEIAVRAGVQGRVFVKAFVDENGNVFKAELIKGIGAGCDESAIAAVLKTKFKPGKQRGKAVRVQVSIPILFKLN
ncbi:MAG: TonB family protein [Ignavibacteriae bacterium]|nr:TonB family protein [Ignavibacteriota bacterium]